MKKSDIEHIISTKIRKAAEEAIVEAIDDLNNAGHSYQPLDDYLFEWAERDSDDSIKITCSIGVGISGRQESRPVDLIVQSFISLAESGGDVEASILNQLEGDIANGGFMQLYDNKGDKFLKECIILLKKIGSKSALRIIEQAQLLFQEEHDTMEKYEKFQKKVSRLNNRFWNLKESIPALFISFRQEETG